MQAGTLTSVRCNEPWTTDASPAVSDQEERPHQGAALGAVRWLGPTLATPKLHRWSLSPPLWDHWGVDTANPSQDTFTADQTLATATMPLLKRGHVSAAALLTSTERWVWGWAHE